MLDSENRVKRSIYTIGHSNQPIIGFIQLLKKYNIEVLVDIRSNPHSKFSPQFDKKNIFKAVKIHGIQYLYLGKELGGKPKAKEFYDKKGNVIYSNIAESQLFRDGITRLEKGLQKYRIAIMCSEENPARCHRWLLVGRALAENGIIINHIRGNGELENPIQLQLERDKKIDGDSSEPRQLSLLEI